MSHTQERLIPPQIQSEPDPTQPTSGGVADNLYYPESTNVGPRGGAEFGSFGKFNRGPKPTYNRSVAGYTGELNEVMPAG